MKLAPKPTPVRQVCLMLGIAFVVNMYIAARQAPSLGAYVHSAEAPRDLLRIGVSLAVLGSFALIERLYYWLRGRRAGHGPQAPAP